MRDGQVLGPWECSNGVTICATSRSQKKLVKKLVRVALGEESGDGLVTDIHSITIDMDRDWETTGLYVGFLFGTDAGT